MMDLFLKDTGLSVSMFFNELTLHSVNNKNVVGSFYLKKMLGE